MPPYVDGLVLIVIGFVLGSFLNVCIHRIPRGQSLLVPGSHCPACAAPIRWRDNIPVFSWFLLGGQCRSCQRPISFRYPLVEIVNVLGYVWIFGKYGWGWQAVAYAAFFSALLTITWIDLDHQIIPDVISLPGIVVGLICSATILPTGIVDAAIGVLIGGGLLWGLAAISPILFGKEGLGGGDIKFLAMIGAFLGWKATLLTLMIAAVTGSVIGVGLIIGKVMTREQYLPFGPFLALGAVIAMLYQSEILKWYLGIG